jgi:hypothetical protein
LALFAGTVYTRRCQPNGSGPTSLQSLKNKNIKKSYFHGL